MSEYLPDAAPSRKGMLRYLLPVFIIATAVLIGIGLMRTAPRARRRHPPPATTLVQTTAVHLATRITLVHAMGTVVPAHAITLAPRVSGQIIGASPEFIPGGRFAAGQVMVRLDSADFLLAVRQRRSALAQARSAYLLEMGQQAIARREYQLLDTTLSAQEQRLVLRTPQRQAAAAMVSAARAALEEAQLDLARTSVRAPFNAVVRERLANVGAQVSSGAPLAKLVGTDAFWVDAAVPVDQLRWIRVPSTASQRGSRARIYSKAAWGDSVFRTGLVIRKRVGLEEKGRMARVLIQVMDPLSLAPPSADAPHLILSSYVQVEIQGRPVKQVAVVARRVLHDGDRVWLMGADGTLQFRHLQVVFRGRDVVYAHGLSEGDRLVTTALAAPVAGMRLRTESASGGIRRDSLEMLP